MGYSPVEESTDNNSNWKIHDRGAFDLFNDPEKFLNNYVYRSNAKCY